MLARTAQTFSQRPSQMLGLTEPLVALALDEALALRLLVESPASAAGRSRHNLPEGQVFATDADFDDSDWHGPVEQRWVH
jgi:hypothetical protein